MKKLCIFVFCFLLLIFGVFFTNLLEVKAANNEDYSDNHMNADYDVMVHDDLGKNYYYKHDDFEYRDNVNLLKYDYSMRNELEVDYGNNCGNRAEDDEEDPYVKYYYLPCCAICLITVSYDYDDDGYFDSIYNCSGSMVGPNDVLTSAENVYNSTYGWADLVTVVPGAYTNEYDVLIKPFGESTVQTYSSGIYHITSDANDNWALLTLYSDIGYNSGWLDVSDTGISNGDTVKTSGYITFMNSYMEFDYSGMVANLQTYKFYHSDNPNYMCNGAPIIDPYTYNIYGIQCSQRVIYNTMQYSQACKISNYIKNWVQDAGGCLEFRIFADVSGQSSGSGFGHAWLSITNNSPWYVTIGKEYVQPNGTITVGTWSSMGQPHSGLYYNYEHVLYEDYNLFTDHRSFKKNIFISQWNLNNNYVLSRDSWYLTNNCTDFAIDVWNLLVPTITFIKPVNDITLPSLLYNQINDLSNHETNAYVYGGEDIIYYENNVRYIHTI